MLSPQQRMALKRTALPALHLQNPIFRASPCETDAERYHLLMVTVQDAKKWGKNARMGERSPSGPKGNTQLYHTKEDVRGAVGRAARVGAAHSHVQS